MNVAIGIKETGEIQQFVKDARVVLFAPPNRSGGLIAGGDGSEVSQCGFFDDVHVVIYTLESIERDPETGKYPKPWRDVAHAPVFDPGDGPVAVDGDEAVDAAVEAFIERTYPLRKQNRILMEKLGGGNNAEFTAMKEAMDAARGKGDAAKAKLQTRVFETGK